MGGLHLWAAIIRCAEIRQGKEQTAGRHAGKQSTINMCSFLATVMMTAGGIVRRLKGTRGSYPRLQGSSKGSCVSRGSARIRSNRGRDTGRDTPEGEGDGERGKGGGGEREREGEREGGRDRGGEREGGMPCAVVFCSHSMSSHCKRYNNIGWNRV